MRFDVKGKGGAKISPATAMRINATGRIETTQSLRRREKVQGAGSAFHLDEAHETHHAPAVDAAIGVGSVEALIAIQQAPDATTGRAKSLARADSILDALDDVRVGLLSGGVPRATLHRLAHLVKERDGEFTDPRLSEVLDEIELRACVELAKLGEAV